jgi:hypothetical protein
MALVSETGKSMYVVMDHKGITDPWVLKNVVPIMFDCPIERAYPCVLGASPLQLSMALHDFSRSDEYPHVIADWPDDIKYLCDALITGPGTMIAVPGMKFSVKRVDAYPTSLEGAAQHNAWWDAMALRHFLRPASAEAEPVETKPSTYNNPRNVAMDQGYK